MLKNENAHDIDPSTTVGKEELPANFELTKDVYIMPYRWAMMSLLWDVFVKKDTISLCHLYVSDMAAYQYDLWLFPLVFA